MRAMGAGLPTSTDNLTWKKKGKNVFRKFCNAMSIALITSIISGGMGTHMCSQCIDDSQLFLRAGNRHILFANSTNK